jgi:hypothetical protein
MTGTRTPLKIVPTHRTTSSIFFHNVRHPVEMAEPEMNQFLTHLAVKEHVSVSTQSQALNALLWNNLKTGEEGKHHTKDTYIHCYAQQDQ